MTGPGFLGRLWFPDIPSCQVTYVEGLLCAQSLELGLQDVTDLLNTDCLPFHTCSGFSSLSASLSFCNIKICPSLPLHSSPLPSPPVPFLPLPLFYSSLPLFPSLVVSHPPSLVLFLSCPDWPETCHLLAPLSESQQTEEEVYRYAPPHGLATFCFVWPG